MLSAYMAFAVLAGIWALGDAVSVKSKGYISAAMIGYTLMLVGCWAGVIPNTIVDDSGLIGIANIGVPFGLVHMGTTIDLKTLKSEWKTVVICLGACVGLCVIMFSVGWFVLGKDYVLAATPVIYGGIVSAMIINPRTIELGIPLIGVYALVLMVLQNVVGIPIASFFLNKEGKRLQKAGEISGLAVTMEMETNEEKKKLFPKLPLLYQTDQIYLFKAALITFLAVWVGQYTQKIYIHPYIVSLFFGFIATQLGFLEKDVLIKAKAYGLFMWSVFLWIGKSLMEYASLEMVLSLIVPVIVTFVISVPALILGACVVGKMLNMSKEMSSAIAMTCLFGFPATIILSEEAAKSNGKTEEERNILETYFKPKMVIGGLFTISTLSGIMASIMVQFIG